MLQTKIEIQKALEQDSSVYEYDSIYDDMKEKQKKAIPAGVAKADKQRKVTINILVPWKWSVSLGWN